MNEIQEKYSLITHKYNSYFHTFIPFNDKPCKLIVGEGSEINVVSKGFAKRMNLQTKPHTRLFWVNWIGKGFLQVSEKCLLPILFGPYKIHVYCDVLPMYVTQILLGVPWIDEYDVRHIKGNKYNFRHDRKPLMLLPAKPRNSPLSKTNLSFTSFKSS